MTLWFIFALMTAVAVFAVLWPLGRRVAARGGDEIAVYRDQLDEIERDRSAGRIGEAEADAAKVEVSRRLIAAADAAEAAQTEPEGAALFRRRAAALAGLVLLPVAAVALYLTLGSPQLPGEPLAARLTSPHENRSIHSLVSQVEAHLERNPQDGRGWEVIAPVYLRLGRYDDAAKAWRRVIALNGATAERQANLGEALFGASNRVVTAEARRAFERAQALDANNARARYYTGLAAEQDGDKEKAAAIWRELLAGAPPDAPWRDTVRQSLARIGAPVPDIAPSSSPRVPTAEDVAAASQMSEAERGEMIRGMVANLAARLGENGADLEGWMRLLRAYMVLGEHDKANNTARNARRALKDDPEKLRRLNALVKDLGLEG